MKKMLMRVAAVAMALVASVTGYAQQMENLPLDSCIRMGVLDNGLTYFIRHNEKPAGQADFYIAQKVGSVLEEDNQRGLAHFLEHMCFNGTENFPDKNLINWLESVGVKFGYNLNAYTSVDETVYNISSVPTARKSVQDSCLIILHDWSCALTLDPKEIDAERGVIHEEWRQSMKGSMRILENLLPIAMPDSRYGERLPMGTMEVVDNFPPQALVDYYHKWYRPDQQGIVVVGDIDPDYIEGKIKEIFSPIPMPENAAERVYFEVEDTPGTIYAIGSDKEMEAPAVMFFFKADGLQLPREYRNTALFFQQQYINHMITAMMNNRLADLAKKPDTEFSRAQIEIGDFIFAKTKDAIGLDVYAKDTDVVPAFAQAYRELIRAARGGFTIGEYERARAEFLSSIESAYEGRDDRETGSYSREIVRFFIDNEAMPGIEYEKNIYDQLAQMIQVEHINKLLPAVISDDNRVLIAMLPEAEGFPIPTEEQFEAAVAAVDAETLEPYKDEMREDPLIPKLPKPGKIKKTFHNDTWDATEYLLSNGVRVIVKPTDFKNNEIVFQAMANGKALSTLGHLDPASIKYMPYALSANGINDYTNSDLKKYLQGKQAAVGFSASDYQRELEGSSTVKDLPTLMELIYGTFTGINLNEDEFVATRDAFAGMFANQENTPQFVFSKDLYDVLYKAPSKRMITSADMKAADRNVILDAVHGMMDNAADYTFVFVGNIDKATFEPLMKQYLATLPANAKTVTTKWVNNTDYEFRPGQSTSNFTTKMETPQSWVFLGAFAEMPFTVKNKLVASVASQILTKRLLNKVREEMGATYSISAHGDMMRTTDLNTFFQTAYPVNPELKEATIEAIREICIDMTQNVSDDEVKPAIEFLIKNNEEKLKDNEEWAGHILATELNGVNVLLNRGEIIPTITADDVESFMLDVLQQGNIRTIILDPEE